MKEQLMLGLSREPRSIQLRIDWRKIDDITRVRNFVERWLDTVPSTYPVPRLTIPLIARETNVPRRTLERRLREIREKDPEFPAIQRVRGLRRSSRA